MVVKASGSGFSKSNKTWRNARFASAWPIQALQLSSPQALERMSTPTQHAWHAVTRQENFCADASSTQHTRPRLTATPLLAPHLERQKAHSKINPNSAHLDASAVERSQGRVAHLVEPVVKAIVIPPGLGKTCVRPGKLHAKCRGKTRRLVPIVFAPTVPAAAGRVFLY